MDFLASTDRAMAKVDRCRVPGRYTSSPRDLLVVRRAGQRPVGPAIITDDPTKSRYFAERGYWVFLAIQLNLAGCSAAFTGLHVWIIGSCKDLARYQALCAELVAADVSSLALMNSGEWQWIVPMKVIG